MITLIKKDFILHKKAILVFLTMVIFYFPVLTATTNGRSVLAISFLYSAMLPLMIFIREDKFKGNALFCSLPFTRRQIVLGRYLSSWVLMVAGMLYCLALSVLINYLFFENTHLFWEKVSLRGILSGFLFLSFIILIWFPLNFRFGIGKGMVVGFLLIGLLMFFLFSFISALGDSVNPVFIARTIVQFSKESMDIIALQTNTIVLYLILILITYLLNYLSFIISLWVFNKKEI